MQPIVFESISKPLLFLHLTAACVTLASGVHLAVRLLKAVRSDGRGARTTRLHATIHSVSYLGVCLLGGAMYPAFRVRVRHEYLDAAVPWATGIFEIKELLATVGVIPVIGIWALSRSIDLSNPEHRRYLPLYLSLIAYVLAIVSYNAISGWYLVTLRSI